MKKLLYITSLLTSCICLSQVKETIVQAEYVAVPKVRDTVKKGRNHIYNIDDVDKRPDYPDGIRAFYAFFSAKFNVPKPQELTVDKLRTYAKFVIEKDGTLSDIKILRDPGYNLGREILRILSLSPKWLPATLNGKAVRTNYMLPVFIDFSKDDDEELHKIINTNEIDTNVAVPDFNSVKKEDENRVFIMPDLHVLPQFPEGGDGFLKFFDNNFNKNLITATTAISVSFIVEKDGTTSFKILKSKGEVVDAETARVLTQMPKWSPGIRNGKPVRSTFIQLFKITRP